MLFLLREFGRSGNVRGRRIPHAMTTARAGGDHGDWQFRSATWTANLHARFLTMSGTCTRRENAIVELVARVTVTERNKASNDLGQKIGSGFAPGEPGAKAPVDVPRPGTFVPGSPIQHSRKTQDKEIDASGPSAGTRDLLARASQGDQQRVPSGVRQSWSTT